MSTANCIDSASRWVLARAFFPAELQIETPKEATQAWRAAQRLRLAPRVAARCGRELLVREVGAAVAERFMAASRQAALQALKTEGLVRYLAAVARELDLCFAVLKGGALHLQRIVAVGARPLCDLDILMSRDGARALHRLLQAQGWRCTSYRRVDYHLPPLSCPPWPVLEIHDYLPWVAFDGRTWSTFEQLKAQKRLESFPAPLDNVFVAEAPILASHAAVAGPNFSAFAIGDVVDVASAMKQRGKSVWPVTAWLRPTVGESQLAALETVLTGWRALDNGCLLSAATVEPWLGALAAIDGLPLGKPRTLFSPLPGSPHPWRGVMIRVLGRVFLSPQELAMRYGTPRASWQYVWLQVRRWCEVTTRELGRVRWLRLDGGHGVREKRSALESGHIPGS